VPRILVADDNTNIQKMVALAFHDRGIDVTAVGNGEAAVRRLPDLNPDLILADIFMPVRNGYELCEWVKKDEKFAHIPVILLVGAFDPLDEKEARRVGADGVLKKPFIPPDPLIAMVTSALEKQSKLPVETAAVKQTAPAPPPPVAVAPVPAKVEITPVPEFPEPSVDDASLAYGFGSGRRALDEEDAGEPAAPLAPKAEGGQEVEEEFEGASTTKDWRRSAMEFEIPEETSRRPAFSSDEDMGSSFPSEADVPPRHVPIPEPVKGIEAAEQKAPEPVPSISWPLVANVEVENEAAPAVSAPVEPQVISAEPVAPAAPAQPLQQAPETEIQEAPAVVAETEPEPSFASKAAHWMDLMASPAEKPQGNWFTSIFSSRKNTDQEQAAAEPQLEKTPVSGAEPSIPSEPEVRHDAQVEASVQPAVETRNEAAGQELNAASETIPSHQVAEAQAAESAVVETTEEDEPFFADEPETNKPALAIPSSVSEEPAISSEPEIRAEIAADVQAEAQAEVQATAPADVATEVAAPIQIDAWEHVQKEAPKEETEELQSIDEPVFDEPVFPEEEIMAGIPRPVDGTPAAVSGELVAEASDEPTLAKDPALVEPPAVHVTPEPLLVDELPVGRSTYGAREQEVAPLYSFLSTMPKASVPAAVAEEPVTESAAVPEEPAQDEEERVLEFSSSTFSKTIPVVAVPHREQLAHIPYLNPPPEFHQPSGTQDSDSAPAATVDTIVQKVLEKLEPQIRELLSQNVLKPLVENMLQSELEKKRR
jgi:CheY-like chemotaxis protein